MAQYPAFAATPKIGQALLAATADASLTAPAVASTIISGGTNGTRVHRIQVLGAGATVAGIARLFLHDGTAFRGLISEVAVTAATPSTTVPAFAATLSDAYNADSWPVLLPSGWSIRASTSIAQAISVVAHGADL